MVNKNINLKLDKEKSVGIYCAIMAIFLKLSNREQQVLSELLQLNIDNHSYSEAIKFKLIFDKDNKKKIQTKLGISSHQLNNIFTSFRKKGIIRENRINNNILISPFKELNINVAISVVNDKS